VPYLSASVVVIQYEEALYQVHAPLPLCTFDANQNRFSASFIKFVNEVIAVHISLEMLR